MSSGGSSGLGWAAYCNGDSTISNATPIYPSVETNTDPQTWSSREVPNFWPYVSNGTETWYAVHLMYFVSSPSTGEPYNIARSIMNSDSPGCLVISLAQGSPTNLAWQPSQQPGSCLGALPSGSGMANNSLQFSDLAAITQNYSCDSWRQPAIMVTSAFSSAPTVYLAVSCFASTS